MLELTRQEKQVIIFLMATAILGVGIICYKSLRFQPKVEIVAGPQLEREIKESRVININTAAKEEIERLRGIGPALAQEILEYRAAHGGFKDKEELKNVKGIGPAKFEAIKENIKVE